MQSNSLGTILFIAFFLFGIGIFVVLIIYGTNKINNREKSISEGAKQRGWQYEGYSKKFTYRLQGRSSQIRWRVDAWVSKRARSKRTNATTKWYTEDINLLHLELVIRSQTVYALEMSALGQGSLAVANTLVSAIGLQKSELGELQQTGTTLRLAQSPLKENFVIVTRDPALVDRLLDARAQGCLKRWLESAHITDQARKSLHVDLGQNNLRVYVNVVLENIESVDLLVELGQTLAQNYQGS